MPSNYTITVEPEDFPILLDDAKSWCKIDEDDEDDLVSALIGAVTDQAEKFMNRVLMTRTYQGLFQGVCISNSETYPFIQIDRSPYSSLTSVEIFSGGDWVELVSGTDFELRDNGGFPRVLFYDVSIVPDTETAYPYRITFVSGYGDGADAETDQEAVPKDIKTALKEHILFFYENRGDTQAEGKEVVPGIAKAIYHKYRILDVY